MSRFAGVRLVGPATLALVLAAGLMTSPAMSQHKDGGDRNAGASTRSGASAPSGSSRSSSFSKGSERSVSGSRTERSSRSDGKSAGKVYSYRNTEDRGRVHHRRHRGGVAVGIETDGYYGYSSSCEYYHRRALSTGSRYWWRRYRECIDD